ncbi:hypothetical protein [Acinetobacter tandoii]|uniref:hypothetical protein n=1 Tax=Acinetobacter tandoii TaxID=202954 RepID=UPI00301726E9
MKFILLPILFLSLTINAHAMSQVELNYLKDYPQASKAILVQDYLFIENSQGDILDQCFIANNGIKNCYSKVMQNKNSNEGLIAFLNSATTISNAIADSYNKQKFIKI